LIAAAQTKAPNVRTSRRRPAPAVAARSSDRISERQEPQFVPACVVAPIAASEVAPSAMAASTAPQDTPKHAQSSFRTR
jgi:hypothetical protein